MPKTARRGPSGRVWCSASIRLRDATHQFSIFGEFMLELRGIHASPCIPNLQERSMLQCNSRSKCEDFADASIVKGDCHGCHHLWRCPPSPKERQGHAASKHYRPLLYRGYGSAVAAGLSRNRAPRISQTRLAPVTPTRFAADPAAFTGETAPASPPGAVLFFDASPT